MSNSLSIAQHLSVAATERPNQPAIISAEGSLTFRQLEEQSNQCARGLGRIGIEKGTPVALMVRPGMAFVILSFALIKLNATLVLIDPGIGRKYLKKCLNEAEPEVFIGSPLAHAARIVLGWARQVRICVTVGGFKPWGGPSLKQVMRLGEQGDLKPESSRTDERVALVFTSGSTGPPKGVLYTHGMFSAQAGLLRDHFGIEPGEIDLATFPLFALFDPFLRVTTVFPEMDFSRPGSVDPRKIIDPIQKHKVTHMFGSPALLDRVGRYGQLHGLKLPTLKRVLSAGAPVSSHVLECFSHLLDSKADIHTPYGATEALPVCSISGREVLKESGTAQGQGVCVGPPIKGVQVAVIEITDDPIAVWSEDLVISAGTIGELVVWGPNVSRAYWGRPEANRLAKIQGENGEVRHRMGDVAYLDAEGRVWFCGRKSQRVITASGILFTVPCESIFNAHPQVYRSALVGVGKAPEQLPVLCVQIEAGAGASKDLKKEILQLGAAHFQTRGIQDLLFHPSFPVDVRHNAKIGRESLALWAGERVS
jgi:acyl-CoA synthetase (AMP-forming)/AMP-acid ligase II